MDNLIDKEFFDLLVSHIVKITDENDNEIPYILNGKNHTYISDFYLPEYKKIIELKANNLFYKKDLASGRIAAKNNAAIQFATENNLSFVMIMDSDIDEFLNTLHKEIV